MITIREERMADHLMKWHIDGLPFPSVIHRIGIDDNGEYWGDGHDHPWCFTSFIMHGSYTEQVYGRNGRAFHRLRDQGSTARLGLDHIHRVVNATADCYTLITPHPELGTQKPGFYRWVDGVKQHRFWDEQEFRPWQE